LKLKSNLLRSNAGMTSAHGGIGMARNDEVEILAQELEAWGLGYDVVENSILIGEVELSNQFRWIAGHLGPKGTSAARSPAERKLVRQEISKRTKELSDVVQAKHIQHHLAFSCIDLHYECVRKRKRQKKSTYLCFLALYICLAHSMTALLAAITAAAAAGGVLR
jgi:hypothetical protein